MNVVRISYYIVGIIKEFIYQYSRVIAFVWDTSRGLVIFGFDGYNLFILKLKYITYILVYIIKN